ncbi:MAG: hypothetical protein HRT44_10325 [Bdellovibrionales bacterium]|nr:hypothetical protein [Bdellovibrionales bacterium]NQZ19635.1 hypothetical protein [Bdellovibrionales bacterium]
MDKAKLFEIVLNQLEENLKVLIESAFTAKEASTNEESKAENKYDTRGLEASYLAAGQAQRAQELQELIYQTKKVTLRDFDDETPLSISALVETELNGEAKKWFFILPVGGIEVTFANKMVQTITIESPIGRSLHNALEGDDFVINQNEYEIVKVY